MRYIFNLQIILYFYCIIIGIITGFMALIFSCSLSAVEHLFLHRLAGIYLSHPDHDFIVHFQASSGGFKYLIIFFDNNDKY
ncbi:MAG TPA: hypothetical protein DC049_17835 [Spirochaetia bacterium]|nr:hypothetical protein [Spirochaetia bacterium]